MRGSMHTRRLLFCSCVFLISQLSPEPAVTVKWSYDYYLISTKIEKLRIGTGIGEHGGEYRAKRCLAHPTQRTAGAFSTVRRKRIWKSEAPRCSTDELGPGF